MIQGRTRWSFWLPDSGRTVNIVKTMSQIREDRTMLFLHCHRRFGTISFHSVDSFHTSRSFRSSTLRYHSPVYKKRDGVGFRYSTECERSGSSILPGGRNAECSCSHLSCPRFRNRKSNTDRKNGNIRTGYLLWQRIHNIKAIYGRRAVLIASPSCLPELDQGRGVRVDC